MTTIAYDGFDMYNGLQTLIGVRSKWTLTGGGNSSMVAGRFGGQAVRITNRTNGTFASAIYLPLNPASCTSSFACGFAFRNPVVTGLGNNGAFFHVADQNSVMQLWLGLNTGTGVVTLYRASSFAAGTVLATTAPGAIPPNNWVYVELEGVIDDTTGSVKVWINNDLLINISGVDTRNAGTGLAVQPWFGGQTSSDNYDADFDDFYFRNTNVRLGESRVETLRGTGDTAVKNWVPNSGVTNFSRINETLVDGDTTYVESGVIGNQDLYDFGDLSSTPATIHAVQLVGFARKTDAGSRGIALTCKSGATFSDGPSYSLSASYSRLDRIMLTDPNTSAAWTAAAVNTLQAGPEVSA